jgi:CubicO group peptidase (beta-lactamase class C family)
MAMHGTRRGFLAGGVSLALLGATRGAGAQAASAWPQAAPESQGLSAPALEAVLSDAAAFPAMRSLVVARNGMLVAERYYRDGAVDKPRRIQSCTKSVVSLLVGQALAQGRLQSLSQTVAQLLPDATAKAPDAPAASLTLRQILTGTTGLAYDFLAQMRELAGAPDPVQYALALPRGSQPAGAWSYNDAAIGLLTPILQRAYGLDLREIARQQLFAPLGIETFAWATDRSGQATAYGGLQLKARDLLKLAWVMGDGGRWGGAQVLPETWVAESLQPHTAGAWPNPPVTGSHYGYLWFTGTLRGRPVAWAWGYGAQFAVLVPSLRLAVATFALEPPPQALEAHNRAVMELVARVVDAAAT